jgi:hypothetical protein
LNSANAPIIISALYNVVMGERPSLLSRFFDWFRRGQATPPYFFSFPCHSGPLDDAVKDAVMLHRSIFLFLYYHPNPTCAAVAAALSAPALCDCMRESFVFLPIDATTPEGWSLAVELDFTQMPLIALARASGRTLAECRIVLTFEGPIGADTILRAMVTEQRRNARVEGEMEHRAHNASDGEEEEASIVEPEFEAPVTVGD